MGASNTESNQTFAASSTGDYNCSSVHAPTGSSEKADPFPLNTELNQISFPVATSYNGNGNGRLSEHSPTATAERVDSFGPFIKSNQTPSTAATSTANGSSSILSTPARSSERGNHPGGLIKEVNQTSSTLPAAPSNVKVLRAHSSAVSSEKAIGTSSKFSSFSSSASSPDSTLDDPFLEFDIEHEFESTSTMTAVPSQGKQSPQASENGKSDHHQIPVSTLDPALTYEHTPKSSPGYVFESPQIQVMESCNNSKYRIPSSVFARKKSTAPDWSMASNESLFSIQMGGASFTRDHYNYFRSGDLGLQGERPSTSGQNKFNSSPKTEAAGGKAATDHHDHWGKSQELSLGVENMKRVPSEGGLEKSNADQGRISHYSVESNSSTKSFAFPVLTGDKDKITSARIGSSVKLCPETPKTPQQQQPQIDHERQPSLKPADESNKEPKSPTAAVPRNRWFSCFPCCS